MIISKYHHDGSVTVILTLKESRLIRRVLKSALAREKEKEEDAK